MEGLYKDLLAGVQTLYDKVSVTLGPQGGNVILFNEEEGPYLTKDGVSVAKKTHSDNPIEDAAIKIVREAALKTAEEAGDGTTTSTILAYNIFKEGLKLINKGINPNTLKREMEKQADNIVEYLKENTEYIGLDKDKLSYIASTSANNDSEIGSIVAEAFMNAGIDGSVLFELSDSSSTYVEHIPGSQFNCGYYNRDFITDKKKGITAFDNAAVVLFKGELNALNQIKDIITPLAKQDTPIVIVAYGFSEKIIRNFLINNYQGNTKIVPIKLTGYSENRKDLLCDIASTCGISAKKVESSPVVVGHCLKIIISYSTTTIIRIQNEEYDNIFNERVDLLKGQVENSPIDIFKRELSRLLGKVSIIYVGGNTEVEAKEKYDRVEDAVCATKAALEEGISAGGGYTLYEASIMCRFKDNPSGLVYKALEAPLKKLCENSGIKFQKVIKNKDFGKKGFNFYTNEFTNLKEEGIIDPTKVLRCAVENAVSAASMLLTTKNIVL